MTSQGLGSIDLLAKACALAWADDAGRAELAHFQRVADRTAFERWVKPEDVAGAVAFLCRPASHDATGTVLAVDCGFWQASNHDRPTDPETLSHNQHTGSAMAPSQASSENGEGPATGTKAGGNPTEAPGRIEVPTTLTIERAEVTSRREHDLLGEMDIPANVYWGIHSLRAIANFPITGVTIGRFPDLVKSLVYVKQAAARANSRLGYLAKDKADAIVVACQRIARDETFLDQFVVDAVQGGAGTSTNMNANEVVANVALEIVGRAKGEYAVIHPNDHVNMSQSTNDAYPTAVRLAIILAADPLIAALEELAYAFKAKAVETSDVLKIGRTQLQDAVPMTLGQEFDAFYVTIKEDVDRLKESARLFLEVNLGATAIGTGINTDPQYAALAVEELSRVSQRPLVQAKNLIEATSDMGAFVHFSGILKRVAVKLSKICNDLRLLSSGPRAGFGEIRLPAVQAGSSIMPGKVNPVIPEVVNQVAFMVIGHDLTVTMCAEGGQLQLNPFEPTIAYCILSSIRHLTAAITTLTTRCVQGIEADREHCRGLVEQSVGLVTALGPTLGYETTSRIANRALSEKRKVADIVLEETQLTRAQLDALLAIEPMTAPSKRREPFANTGGAKPST